MNNSFRCVTMLADMLSDGFPIQGFSYNADESMIVRLYEPTELVVGLLPFGTVEKVDSYTIRVSFSNLKAGECKESK